MSSDPLIRDIKRYLAGQGDGVAAAVLLTRALEALTQREDNPPVVSPTPTVDALKLGAAVRVRGLNLPITGEIIEHDPGEYGEWWVRFDFDGESRYFWYRSEELELA